MMKMSLSCFGHMMRRKDSLEEMIMQGKVGGSRKRRRANTRWIDSFKGPTGLSLQRLSRAVEDRAFGDLPFIGSP